MEQDKSTLGKIVDLDIKKGVGTVVSAADTYMFTVDDINSNDISVNDYVKFRAEKVHNQNRAYFLKKYNENDSIYGKIIKSKVYKSNK